MTVVARSTIHAVVIHGSARRGVDLVRILQRDGDIAVVASATTAASAVELVAQLRPQVVVLDLRLEDGVLAVERIMATVPTPILVLTAPTEDRRSPAVLRALVAGALETLPEPASWTAPLESELRRCLRQIQKVTVIRHPRGRTRVPGPPPAQPGRSSPVVGLAASTGGPSALATVLSGLNGLRAPVLVVQHLHPDFTPGLAEWMARATTLPVEIAEPGTVVVPGRVYLAPGGRHLRMGAERRLELPATPVSLHCPSADELFRSLAERVGPAATGVLLTGMGEDGARGLLELRQAGGRTFAQDEASSAVFGMPQAAYRIGAVTDLLPLEQVAAAVHRAVAGGRT